MPGGFAVSDSEQKDDRQVIYVLEARADSLRGVVNFLTNRDWKINATTKIKEFLAQVLTNSPKFVMICIDHPGGSAAQLPRLVANAFPGVAIMVYVDGKSSASLNKLKIAGHEYSLYPPLSGPAVERMVLKIEKDRIKKAEAEAKGGSPGSSGEKDSGGGDESVVIKGSGQLGKGSAADLARQTLAKFMSSADDGDSATSLSRLAGTAPVDTGTSVAQTGSGHTSYFDDGTPRAESELNADSEASSGSRAERSVDPRKARKRSPFMMNGQRSLRRSSDRQLPPGQPDDQYDELTREELDEAHAAEKLAKAIRKAEAAARGVPDEDPSGGYTRKKKKGPATFEQGDGETTVRGRKANLEDDAIIIKAVESAMSAATIRRTSNGLLRLRETTSVTCISVESDTFKGYLVAALAKGRKMDKIFMATVRARLVEFMKESLGEFSSEDLKELNLHEVEFEDWAFEQAEFLRKTVHEGQEIAIAFFPTEIQNTPLEISANENMLRLNIQELKGDVTVEFDLYVHLPANNKYILYTREQQRLFANQLERLKSKGVESMHLRKDSESDIRRYRVRNFLNEKIAEHQNSHLENDQNLTSKKAGA